MAVKIRLARGGRKKAPVYFIIAADSRSPRDGKFLEKLGNYAPLMSKDSSDRVTINAERVKYWLGNGAQPTERVAKLLKQAGITA